MNQRISEIPYDGIFQVDMGQAPTDYQLALLDAIVDAEDAQFMALLTRLLGVRRYLEIGAYTGYSALAVALAMEADGQVVTCEIDEAIARTAKRHGAMQV